MLPLSFWNTLQYLKFNSKIMYQMKHQVLSPTSSKKSYTCHMNGTSGYHTLLVHTQEYVNIATEIRDHMECWNFHIV